jgi:hypothetical protein
MNTYYANDCVEIDDTLFESMPVALGYIAENFREWCSLYSHEDAELVSVTIQDNAMVIWVEYRLVDFDPEDYAEGFDGVRQESFDYTYREITLERPTLVF